MELPAFKKRAYSNMGTKIFRIACIGSREITLEQSELFAQIGEYIVSQGWYLSSGNADGSDSAFAKGANKIKPENVILYLPWQSYNIQHINPKNRILGSPFPEWEDLTKPFHGAWDKLSQGGRKLMARNYGIIHRADKVIALLNHSKPGFGGTGQAWRIAESLKIPKLDLNDQTLKQVVKFLNKKVKINTLKK